MSRKSSPCAASSPARRALSRKFAFPVSTIVSPLEERHQPVDQLLGRTRRQAEQQVLAAYPLHEVLDRVDGRCPSFSASAARSVATDAVRFRATTWWPPRAAPRHPSPDPAQSHDPDLHRPVLCSLRMMT